MGHLLVFTAETVNGHDDIIKCIISLESKVYTAG